MYSASTCPRTARSLRSLSQLSVTMIMPAMQKPVTTRSANHATGSTTSTWHSAATDTMDAKAANARM